MPTNTDMKDDATPQHGEFTVEELIRSQLQGKSRALERYDDILWKIRAGYVAGLYGLLTILSGKEFELSDLIGTLDKIEVLFYTAIGFSLCALSIDMGFLVAKLRVVQARNTLSELALDLAATRPRTATNISKLKPLLHLSGEAPIGPKLNLFLNAVWPIVLLYLTTPLMISVFRAYMRP